MTEPGTDCGDTSNAGWFAFGPYLVCPGERTLKRNGQLLQIGDKVLDLLLAFIVNPGEILSKSDLAHRVWRRPFIEDGSLRVAIGALRKLLGQTEEGGDYVINVVGRGYALSPTVKFERWPEPGAQFHPRPRQTVGTANGRLPPLLTPVFGRRHDIQRITDLLSQSRFITVVGPGGIGKTTVAISCASLRADADGGACFVDLAPIRDLTLVPSRIATALGAEQSSDPLDFISNHLASQRLLLILDNAEHVADSVARVVAEILGGAPHVKVIVTSREPLAAAGETVYRLEPLKLPPTSYGLSAAEAMKYDAIELFVDRVQANAPGFSLTDVLAPAAAEICQKLDGVALAIRLAAGRVQAFGVNGIARLLESKLDLLSQNQRTAPSRHQTLKAAFDWSYDLLSSDEQALLASMAIFSHSFSLEAIQRVATASEDPVGKILAMIGDLVAKSLVSFIDDESGARYRLLETVRVFALARLEESGARPRIARRHADHVIGRCEAYQAELIKGRGRHAASIASSTVDDARTALQWAMNDLDWPLASKLIHSAAPLLTQFGFTKEVGGWIRSLLDVEAEPKKRLPLMISLGGAMWLSAPEDVAMIKVYTEAYTLARSLGDEPAQLRAARSLILSTCNARRPPEAIKAAEMLVEKEGDAPARDFASSANLTRVLAGVSRHLVGDYATCERSLRWLLEHHPVDPRGAEADAYLYDPRHIGRPFLAWIEYFSGRLSDAAATSECLIVDAGDHVPSIVNYILRTAFPIAVDSGRWEAAWAYIDMLERHCSDRAAWCAWIAATRDVLAVRTGQSPEALRRLEDFVTGGEKFARFRRQTWYYMTLIKGYLTHGYYRRAEYLLQEVLRFVETSEGNWWRPEMLTLDGHLLAPLDRGAAYARYHEAFTLAHAEGSTLLELRAALGAMRVADDPVDRADARRQARDAYHRLIERSPTAGNRENLRLLRYSVGVCRTVQRTSRSIIPTIELAAA